jgi:hypothetical protein
MEELSLANAIISDLRLPSQEEVSSDEVPEKEKSISRILYAVSKSILELLWISLTGSSANQEQFREAHGIKCLFSLLSDKELRRAALRLVAVLAVGDVTLECKIIPDLIVVLQSSGGSSVFDPETLQMRIGELFNTTPAFQFPSSCLSHQTFSLHSAIFSS